MDVPGYIDTLDETVRRALAPWVERARPPLLERTQLVRIARGQELVRMLDRCEHVYVLCRGRVRTASHTFDGNAFIIDEFAAPAVFGEMETIAESPLYHGTVAALEDCEFIALNRTDYLAWLRTDAAFMLERARWTVQSLLKQAGTERSLLSWSGVERIMFVLWQLCRQQGEGGTIELGVSRAELAERANVCTKTVSRALAALEGRGMLRRSGRKIVVDRTGFSRLEAAMRQELESSLRQSREKEER